MARGAWEPTQEVLERIEECAASGLSVPEICESIGVSTGTFYTKKKSDYPEIDEALKRGRFKSHMIVHNALMKKIHEGDLGAIVWYEKSRRGMSDKMSVESGDVTINILNKDYGTES